MTSLERCLTVLQGGVPDRVPVIPQTFMFSLETAGMRMRDVVRSAAKMAEAQQISIEKYGYDGCVIDFDDASLAEACGARVIYRDDEPAVVDESTPAVKDWRGVDSLEVPDPWRDGRLPIWLEATRLLVQRIGDHAFVMGRADQGPFTLACLLRGPQQFMMDLASLEDLEPIHRLIDYCRQACAVFARAQKDAGAHATSIGDAFASPNLLSPAMFRRFALQPEARLVEEVQAYGIPMSIHICGNTSKIIADMGSTGARILEVDWKLDMAEARRLVPATTVLMGNLNPSDPLVLGTPEQVRAAARAVIEATGGRGLILSSGCAMGRDTPPDNLRAMIASAEQYGPPAREETFAARNQKASSAQ
jgi:MtaA/CmuA family methyltransferase